MHNFSFDKSHKRHERVDLWQYIGVGDVLTILYIRTRDREYGSLYFSVNDGELEKIISGITFDQHETYKFAVTMPSNCNGELWELLQ